MSHPTSHLLGPSWKRRRARARERGAAIFVVVLVVTLLLGIGIFAARSATLSTAVSGNIRQMTQTHYVAEYAMLLAVAKLTPSAGSGPQSYLSKAGDPTFGDYGKCQAQAGNLTRPTCYRLSYEEVQADLAAKGYTVFPTYGLGSPSLEGYFWVELPDVSGPAAAPPGMAMNAGNQTPQFYDVTATAVAQVRTLNTAVGAALDPSAEGSQSMELTRAFLRVGPMNLN